MSGTGTRTKSGQKARAKSVKRGAAADAKSDAKSGEKSGEKSGAKSGGRRAVRSGAAPAPPRRARPAPVDPEGPRRRGRRVAVWTVGIVVVGLAVVVGAALSPFLDVESVTVRGVASERAAAVVDAAGIADGDPILGFLPGRAAARIEDLPWVEQARVVRDLPGSVRIDVVPRIPVGWTTAGDRILVVDAGGTVIERTDVVPAGIPELTGVADVGPVGGEIRPRSLAASAGALGPELRMRIATVGLADAAITAQVVYGPQLRFGVPDRMAVKARVAAAVLASLAGAPVAYVDVSVPAAPVTG